MGKECTTSRSSSTTCRLRSCVYAARGSRCSARTTPIRTGWRRSSTCLCRGAASCFSWRSRTCRPKSRTRPGGESRLAPCSRRRRRSALPTSEQVLLDLACRRLGQLCDHLDDVGHHEPGDATAQELTQLLRLHRHPWLEHHHDLQVVLGRCRR